MNTVELYKKLRDGSPTYNSLNRTLIDLEDRLTISELTAIRDFIVTNGLKDDRKIAEKDWINSFNRHKVALKNPASFERTWLHKDSFYYRRTTEPSERVLLIGFTGKRGRMMMPIWAFLAALPEEISDVLILKAKWNPQNPKNSYPNQVSKFNDLISTELNKTEFKKLLTIGVSGGALPALIFGLKFKADRIASVSMISADDNEYDSDYKVDKKALEENSDKIKMAITFRDPAAVKTANRLRKDYSKIQLIKYIDPDHAILAYLLRRGRLKKSLRKLLV